MEALCWLILYFAQLVAYYSACFLAGSGNVNAALVCIACLNFISYSLLSKSLYDVEKKLDKR